MDIERIIANYVLRPIFLLLKLVFWPVLTIAGRILAWRDERKL